MGTGMMGQPNARDGDTRMQQAASGRIATDLLLTVSERARVARTVAVSAIQGLANARALAGGRYDLSPGAVRDAEALIILASKEGPLDSKLQNLDPAYLRRLGVNVVGSTVGDASTPRSLREFLADPIHPAALDPSRDVFEVLGGRARSRALFLAVAMACVGLACLFVWMPLGVGLLAIALLAIIGAMPTPRGR